MSGPSGARFADLGVRVGSGLVLAGVGLGAVWAGGVWFAALVLLALAAMAWELGRIALPDLAQPTAVAGALALAVAVIAVSYALGPVLAIVLLLLPALALALVRGRAQAPAAAYLALICLAGHAFIVLRVEFGLIWIIWLVLLVIGSDVAGYFAGRFIGGPKFWPRISPKKTWSGTVAGWVLGLAIGAGFMVPLEAGAGLLLLSLVIVLAGQMGDIAESAIKRRAGIKDASALIPGHGGVMDRLDAMMGAAVAFLLLARLGLVAAAGV